MQLDIHVHIHPIPEPRIDKILSNQELILKALEEVKTIDETKVRELITNLNEESLKLLEAENKNASTSS